MAAFYPRRGTLGSVAPRRLNEQPSPRPRCNYLVPKFTVTQDFDADGGAARAAVAA